MSTTARTQATAGEPPADPEDDVLLPMMLETLTQAIEDGLEPDKAKKIASELITEVIPPFTKVLAIGLHRGKAELLNAKEPGDPPFGYPALLLVSTLFLAPSISASADAARLPRCIRRRALLCAW